jgi:26S proteasome regulatory subunit N10
LALKHRQNNSQRPRIIVFICSPVEDDEKSLVKLALAMKKQNISIDFIVFGDLESDNTKKLEAFNEKVKGKEGSHMEIIPPGPSLLSDALVTTPILQGEGGGSTAGGQDGGAGGDGGPGAFEFGVDPSVDPDLALALRMSFEENKAREEAREERESKEQEQNEGKTNLEGIREEDEAQPLLDKKDAEDAEESSGDKKDEKDDTDKMDTA